MVATCRALETELEDVFVHDPFAARLAGERGLAILRALPHSAVVRFGLAVRTRFVDESLLDALALVVGQRPYSGVKIPYRTPFVKQRFLQELTPLAVHHSYALLSCV